MRWRKWRRRFSDAPSAPKITLSTCSPVAGDSTYDDTKTYFTAFTKSHLIGLPTLPVYKLITTRKLADNSDVTIDYMVHEPASTPKGVIVLIAGGNLRAKIQGTNGNQPTNSSGNFVVRSAHRYQAAGYRVITIDRPSDSVNITNADTTITFGAYGDSRIGRNIDLYRTSMQHAVDIASILKLENTEGFNVIISGTSRGAISSAAMNTLAAGISMSSSLTAGGGTPVGSTNLPLSRIKRDSHVLFHTDDSCPYTLPAYSRTLFDSLVDLGITVTGNEVNGGFRNDNPANQDVCGAFDYHGFNGIETCAVSKETAWADNLVSGLAANNAPIADNQTVKSVDTIILSANDTDGDTLSYALPIGFSSLGGIVSTDTAGNVTYTASGGVAGTTDTFAFTVTDGKGGVSTAVISVIID